MNIYEKKARLYPAIIAFILPCALLLWSIWTTFPSRFSSLPHIYRIMSTIGCAGVLMAAFSFFGREICRITSKRLFQFWIFKEDETYMPSTDLLIYEKSVFSVQQIDNLRKRICDDFTIHIPAKDQQIEGYELRRTITDAVRMIREKTRTNPILLDYNIRYGFCRNLLGGLTCGLMLTVFILLGTFLDIFTISAKPVVFILFLQLVMFIGAILQLKSIAREYARQLFNVYLTI